MKTFATFTLGCKVNQVETQWIEQNLKENDYQQVNFSDLADVYIINTCTVTHLSDRKSRQLIRKARKQNPRAIIAAIGCYAQHDLQAVQQIESVNIIMGTSDKEQLVPLIERATCESTFIHVPDIMKQKKFEELYLKDSDKSRAFIKIQDGCDRFCSYCIIPFTRGPVRSLPLDQIYRQCQILVDKGYQEIVLTGIHIASYGKDFVGVTLIDVLKKIAEIPEIQRVRLGSIEPTIISDEFLASCQQLGIVCPHFHLSLQSGSENVLKRMKRHYTKKEFYHSVQQIRNFFPYAAITTDVIVGFPMETQEEHQESMDFVKSISFADIHVFPYSERKQTSSAKLYPKVDEQVKHRRVEEMISIANQSKKEFFQQNLGRVVKVLIESSKKETHGYSENYIPVYLGPDDDLVPSIKDVLLTGYQDQYMMGRVCE